MRQTIAKALVAGMAAVLGVVSFATYADSFVNQQQGAGGLNVPGSNTISATAAGTEPALLTTVKKAINLVL